MERLTAVEARKRLPEAVQRVAYGGERFIVTVHGTDRAALVPIADLHALERYEDDEDARLGEQALADYEAGRTRAYSLDEAATALSLGGEGLPADPGATRRPGRRAARG